MADDTCARILSIKSGPVIPSGKPAGTMRPAPSARQQSEALKPANAEQHVSDVQPSPLCKLYMQAVLASVTWKILYFCCCHELASSDTSNLVAFEYDRFEIGPSSINGCSIPSRPTANDHQVLNACKGVSAEVTQHE